MATDGRRDVGRRDAPSGSDRLSTAPRVGRPGRHRASASCPTRRRWTRHGPARIIALCNQKGGVGKTTTTINLGAALAEYGRRVLLVDFDPQGALSVGLGVQPAPARPHDLQPADGARRHASTTSLLKTERRRAGPAAQQHRPVRRRGAAGQRGRPRADAGPRAARRSLDDYDFILIDCQPSLGLLTVNALTAAHGVIIPLECEFFACAASRC